MPFVIECPSCARRYGVATDVQGKRVRCQGCGNVFTATPTTTQPPQAAAAEPFDPLGIDLSQLPAPPSPSTPSLSTLNPAANPLGTPPAATGRSLPAIGTWQNGQSNPSGGPTDLQMRLACCGMLALGVVVSVGSFVLQAAQGTVYLGIVILMPLMFVLGIAGLISPNVVRAVGKYGGHLPWHYKAIGWAVIGFSFLLMVLLMVGLFLAGFEPERPGRRNRAAVLSHPPMTALRAVDD